MSQCLSPDCLAINSETALECYACQSKMLLRDRYRGLKILGQGSFGRTFLARDEDKPSKPYCVIKQLLPQAQGTQSSDKASQLFAREGEILEKLGKNPHIPELLAYFSQGNRQYLVQEFVDGQNLHKELERKGVFREEQIRDILYQMLQVLQFIHKNQFIHRDIKPENMMKRETDNQLFLVDFGASKVIDANQTTKLGTIIGTEQYMAPEQRGGKVQYASDLYSLGVTCIHLLTGFDPVRLFNWTENQWNWRKFLKNNPVNDQLGDVLDRLIALPIATEETTAMAKYRFASAEEALNALDSSYQETLVFSDLTKETSVPSSSETPPSHQGIDEQTNSAHQSSLPPTVVNSESETPPSHQGIDEQTNSSHQSPLPPTVVNSESPKEPSHLPKKIAMGVTLLASIGVVGGFYFGSHSSSEQKTVSDYEEAVQLAEDAISKAESVKPIAQVVSQSESNERFQTLKTAREKIKKGREKLEAIPESSKNHSKAQEKIATYSSQLNEIKSQIRKACQQEKLKPEECLW